MFAWFLNLSLLESIFNCFKTHRSCLQIPLEFTVPILRKCCENCARVSALLSSQSKQIGHIRLVLGKLVGDLIHGISRRCSYDLNLVYQFFTCTLHLHFTLDWFLSYFASTVSCPITFHLITLGSTHEWVAHWVPFFEPASKECVIYKIWVQIGQLKNWPPMNCALRRKIAPNPFPNHSILREVETRSISLSFPVYPRVLYLLVASALCTCKNAIFVPGWGLILCGAWRNPPPTVIVWTMICLWVSLSIKFGVVVYFRRN